MDHSRLPLLCTLGAVLLIACGGAQFHALGPGAPLLPGQIVSANATVRRIAVEGGCWALETPAGRYQPVSLPTTYQIDGLQVFVVLQGSDTTASICMIAPLAVVDSIRTR